MKQQNYILPSSYQKGYVYFLCERDPSRNVLGYIPVEFVNYLAEPPFICVKDVAKKIKACRDDVFTYIHVVKKIK